VESLGGWSEYRNELSKEFCSEKQFSNEPLKDRICDVLRVAGADPKLPSRAARLKIIHPDDRHLSWIYLGGGADNVNL